jgi:hypothetical protein
MKHNLLMLTLALALLPVTALLQPAGAQTEWDDDRDRELSYQDFYDGLSPYGRWVEYPGTGFVWVPDAGPDFRPYETNGRWVWTEEQEWMWVSDYEWGWAPFHYGRWDHDADYGWYWVPGYEWAPAWVAWRDGGDFYGWAPLRPGVNMYIHIGTYNPPDYFWCFTPRRHILSARLWEYAIDRRQNTTIMYHTTLIQANYSRGNYGFRSGPSRWEAERWCGRINPVRLRDMYRPGPSYYRNDEIGLYRPRIRPETDRSARPGRFERYDRADIGSRDPVVSGEGRHRSFRVPENPYRREQGSGDVRREDRMQTPRYEPRRVESGNIPPGRMPRERETSIRTDRSPDRRSFSSPPADRQMGTRSFERREPIGRAERSGSSGSGRRFGRDR